MKNLKQFSVFLFFILMSISAYSQSAQQLQINEFVLYSTKAMKIDKEVKVNQTATNLKGTIGSKADISFKKISVINANIISQGVIDLDKESTIKGNINAGNYLNSQGEILKGEKNLKITGNLEINGKINLTSSGSMITGSVRQPIGASYTGPSSTLGRTI